MTEVSIVQIGQSTVILVKNGKEESELYMEDAIRIIEGLDTSNSEENIEAKKMAVAAMKKQIHQKVIKKDCEEITSYLCPTCKEVLRNQWGDGFIIGCKKTYCDKCGQRLDWSDDYDKRR